MAGVHLCPSSLIDLEGRMAVYYRYRSGVDTFSLPVAAPSISVGEVKRLILATSRHGHGRTRRRGPREGVAISDAQTGEEYTDDSALVLRNSTVVVRRVAGPPADTIVTSPSIQRPKANQESSSDSSDSSASRSSVSAGAEEDEEAKAISAVINAAKLKWEGPCGYGHRGSSAYYGRAPSAGTAGYVCHTGAASQATSSSVAPQMATQDSCTEKWLEQLIAQQQL